MESYKMSEFSRRKFLYVNVNLERCGFFQEQGNLLNLLASIIV